jgi:hypothetical protein
MRLKCNTKSQSGDGIAHANPHADDDSDARRVDNVQTEGYLRPVMLKV